MQWSTIDSGRTDPDQPKHRLVPISVYQTGGNKMLSKIGTEQWDFVDADGEQIALPPADTPAADIRFPTTWRVFGPLSNKSKIAPIQIITDRDVPDVVTGLRALPETLTIDGETLSGQDVELDGNSLDLNQFCEAYATVFFDAFGDLAARVGRQAYVFAELELDEETVVPSVPDRISGCNGGSTDSRSMTPSRAATRCTHQRTPIIFSGARWRQGNTCWPCG